LKRIEEENRIIREEKKEKRKLRWSGRELRR